MHLCTVEHVYEGLHAVNSARAVISGPSNQSVNIDLYPEVINQFRSIQDLGSDQLEPIVCLQLEDTIRTELLGAEILPATITLLFNIELLLENLYIAIADAEFSEWVYLNATNFDPHSNSIRYNVLNVAVCQGLSGAAAALVTLEQLENGSLGIHGFTTDDYGRDVITGLVSQGDISFEQRCGLYVIVQVLDISGIQLQNQVD